MTLPTSSVLTSEQLQDRAHSTAFFPILDRHVYVTVNLSWKMIVGPSSSESSSHNGLWRRPIRPEGEASRQERMCLAGKQFDFLVVLGAEGQLDGWTAAANEIKPSWGNGMWWKFQELSWLLKQRKGEQSSEVERRRHMKWHSPGAYAQDHLSVTWCR